MPGVKYVCNKISSDNSMKEEEEELIRKFSAEQAENTHAYHKSIPDYKPTPLVNLASLAQKLSLSKLWVKDESKRFNLNAFKVLGSSYALAKYLSGSEPEPLNFEDIKSKVNEQTLLVSATDGNHGYGVAFIAKLVNCKAKVGIKAF